MPRRPDTELEQLFSGEPELLDLASLMRDNAPDPELDPRFKAVLRARLLREAPAVLQPRRRWYALRLRHIAVSGAAALAMTAALLLTVFNGHGALNPGYVALQSSNVAGQHALNTDQAIQLSFDQPMNEQVVESGVHITPATAVTFSWSGDGKTLTLVPAHPLASDTPYTVTIPKDKTVSSTGQTAAADIAVSFGTAPVASSSANPTPPPPALQLNRAGTVAQNAGIVFTPAGDVASEQALLPAAAPESPQASERPSVLGVPATSPSQITEPQFASFGSNGPVVIGPAATWAAFSADGQQLAAAVADKNGSEIVVSLADGSQTVVLTKTSDRISQLAWSSSSTIVYIAGTAVYSVDLQKRVSNIDTYPTGSEIVLSPNGQTLFVKVPPQLASPSASGATAGTSASADGSLVSLLDHSSNTLPGSSSGIVTFSGAGNAIAWVDTTQTPKRLLYETISPQATPATVTTINVVNEYFSAVSLSNDGSIAAYSLVSPNGDARFVLTKTADGSVLSVNTGSVTNLTFSADGRTVAFDTALGDGGTQLDTAAVPGSSVQAAQPTIPPAAVEILNQFVNAQIKGDAATLHELSDLPSGTDPASLTPHNISRGYVISAAPNPDGSVAATARLIVDPTAEGRDPQFSDESIVVTENGGVWKVTSLVVPALTTETNGPHVLHVTTGVNNGSTIVAVTFDSDLKPATVGSAFHLVAGDGSDITVASINYDATTRTVTITVNGTPGQAQLTIANSLQDIDGQPLAAGYQTQVGS